MTEDDALLREQARRPQGRAMGGGGRRRGGLDSHIPHVLLLSPSLSSSVACTRRTPISHGPPAQSPGPLRFGSRTADKGKRGFGLTSMMRRGRRPSATTGRPRAGSRDSVSLPP